MAVPSSVSLKAGEPGEVIGWGNNSFGQANIPLEKTLFTAVAGGYYHSLGLKTDGSISAAGRGNYGQCNVPEPNMGFTAIAAGGWHSLGLKSDGSIVAWGRDDYGQSSLPWPNAGFTAIAAGYSHSLGLKSDGSIVAWGRNDYGQCSVPAPNTDFVAIAAGSYHSLGLKSNGSIVAWGYNYDGQCDVPTPNSGFTAVAAGSEHSLARRSDGSIAAWGRNIYGQCTVPSPNANFIGIAAGAYHSLGLKSNGSIVAFGNNSYGQSGVPLPNTGYVAIAAGGEHSLAVASVDVSSGDVNYGLVFQQIYGFGGAAVYEPADLINRSYREEVCDMLFKDLGIDLLRIRNTYGYPGGGYDFYATGQVVAEAKQRNPNIKILLTPWSPAAYLKSNDNINGGGTLKKDGQGNYIYADYAYWWADSIEAFADIGVHPDYISIQNEPDFETSYDSMKLTPVEDSSYAGYDQAFEAVYQELFWRMGYSMPKMIGPDTMGYSVGEQYYSPRGSRDYIDNLINEDHCYAFAFHPYGDGWGAYGYDNPDFLVYSMTEYAAEYGYRPLIMTEFCRLNKTPDFNDAVNLGWHIHNFLTYMRVKAYYHWTLFRGYGTGGMINVKDPNFYIVRDLFWFLKGYAHFTDPGWFVLGSSVDLSNLRITAFKNPLGTKLTIVIVNVSSKGVDLTLNVSGFSPVGSKIYRSSEIQHWSYIGAFNSSQALPCPRRSITTISLSIGLFEDCSEALAAGHRLAADIGGVGDCYVDYFDFVTLADHWLSTDCVQPDNCHGADFEPSDGVVDFYDLGDFVSQWMHCNDPENPDCMLN
jgi:O-glycosyl hydrolase